MRRAWIGALVLFAVAAAMFLAWDRPESRVGPTDEVLPEGAEPEAPPSLAGAPPNALGARRAKTPRPGASESEEAAPEVRGPTGTLTVRLEVPPSAEPFGQRRIHLFVASGETSLTGVGPGKVASGGEAGEPWIEPLPLEPNSASPAPVWRVNDLPAGTWLVRAETEGGTGSATTWRAAIVRTRGEVEQIDLGVADPRREGRLLLSATRAGVPEVCGYRVEWRGLPLAHVQAKDAEATEVLVPPDEDLFVVPIDRMHLFAPGPPGKEARVRVAATESISFELASLVQVSVKVLTPDGTIPPRASFALWRTFDRAGPEFVFTAQQMPDSEKKTAALTTNVAPGDYLLLVTDVGPFPQRSVRFRVGATGPETVEVLLAPARPSATFLVRDHEGKPAVGRDLWIGQLDGLAPEETATALVRTDAEGRADLGPLPDGEYYLAAYTEQSWRTIVVHSTQVEPAVVTLPRPGVEPVAKLRGRVRTRAGKPVPTAWISLGPADGWCRYACGANGRFEIGADAGEGVLTIVHSWYTADRFTTWSRPVVVEAGKDQWIDARVSPR